jgi:hypothetical protein
MIAMKPDESNDRKMIAMKPHESNDRKMIAMKPDESNDRKIIAGLAATDHSTYIINLGAGAGGSIDPCVAQESRKE